MVGLLPALRLGALCSALALVSGTAVGAVETVKAPPAHQFAQAKPAQPAAQSAQAATAAESLPNGASSVQETFQDWQVACVQQGPAKRCSLAQQQIDQQSRQRVLAVELTPAAGKAQGILILPFGLAFEKGATLQVDDGAVGQPLRFQTCIPGGCIVPVTFEGAALSGLRQGTTLKIKAASVDGNKDTTFSVSLKGFGPAFDRTAALLK